MDTSIGKIARQKQSPVHFAMSAWPHQWRRKALEIRRAADVLFAQLERDHAEMKAALALKGPALTEAMRAFPESIVDQSLMLAAFALENLLKGQLVALSADTVKDGRLSPQLASHNLRRLAADAGITLSEDEVQLLLILEEAAVVSGRYPIPKKSEHSVQSRSVNIASTYACFRALFDRVSALVGETMLPGAAAAKRASP